MSDQPRYEKPEKEDEKHEKDDEKKPDEKRWDEKWRSNPLGGVVLAAILIWAGLVLIAENTGLLQALGGIEAWSVIMLGAGAILLIEAVVRLLVPTYRRRVTGTVILGVILFGVGLGGIARTEIVFPLLLIGVGAVIIVTVFLRRK